jgi:hypothetical protein
MLQASVSGWYVLVGMVSQSTQSYERRTSKQMQRRSLQYDIFCNKEQKQILSILTNSVELSTAREATSCAATQ